MAAITDFMFNTSYVEEVLSYIETTFNIRALILDSSGRVSCLGNHEKGSLPLRKFFQFDFTGNIGGIEISSYTRDALDKAEPHVGICLNGINELLKKEVEFQQTADEMLFLSEQLNFLFKLADRTIGIDKLDEFFENILSPVKKALDADQAFYLSLYKGGNVIRITSDISPQAAQQVSRGDAFQVVMEKEATAIFSLSDRTSVLIAPVRGKEGVAGYMVFFRGLEKRFFTAYEKKFIGIIENIISPTVEALRLYDDLQTLYVSTVKSLAAAIDAKDEYTYGHSFRVARYSVAIGKKMNMSKNMVSNLEIAAYMHDLGKIGIPGELLGKPGKLTAEEYEIIKTHPELTEKILQPMNLPPMIVDGAVQHHERLDGSGYPRGLKEDEISLFGKIIAVADVFDALTSARPYRDFMSIEKAFRILVEGIDRNEFDRKIVLDLIFCLRKTDRDEESSIFFSNLKFSDENRKHQFYIDLAEQISSSAKSS
ncbi:MAG: HD-GYP domain-containing protein [Desulfobulbaceae bacterium]|nr:HD-GYP domain-containing protein [Desulfobulbaceae bacterium]MCK5543754.1 HD-GYP domain-containing protein [Desulfobulbaceae bacterium]